MRIFKVAIVGAGPAGCMLARLLTHDSEHIGVTVFEGEDGLDYRIQGGTLDLHVKTGQRALKEAGFYDKFLNHARFDSEAMALADMMEQEFMVPVSPRNGIERYLLRAIEDELGWWLTKLCTPLVHAYYFVFRLIW